MEYMPPYGDVPWQEHLWLLLVVSHLGVFGLLVRPDADRCIPLLFAA